MYRFFSVIFFLLSVFLRSNSQPLFSEVPFVREGGVVKCTRVVVAFNQNVFPTTRGVTLVDTTRFPVQHQGLRTFLRSLQLRYGTPAIRKTFPNAIWGDTLATSRRTGRRIRVRDLSQNFTFDFPVAVPLDSVLNAFRSLPIVRYAEEPISVRPLVDPNDYFYLQGEQWYLAKIRAPQAWNITTGISSIKIAIIDVRGPLVVSSHEDFQLPEGQNKFVGGDGSTGGTHPVGVAGVAAATTNNGTGIASLGWNTSLLGYYFNENCLDPPNPCEPRYRLPALIDSAANEGADVINFSIGTYDRNGCPAFFESVGDAISKHAADVVFVGAAGNTSIAGCSGGQVPYAHYPAAFPEVIAVSGTDINDDFIESFNYGFFVDCSAPSMNIKTLFAPPNLYTAQGGTSFGAPQVSALAALILSVNSSITPAEVERIIAETADKVDQTQYPYINDPAHPYSTWNSHLGYGRINAYKALSLANGRPNPPTINLSIIYEQGIGYPRLAWNLSAPDIEAFYIWRELTGPGLPGGFQLLVLILRDALGYLATSHTDYTLGMVGSGQYTASYNVVAQDASGYYNSDPSNTVSVNYGNAYKLVVTDPGKRGEFSLHQNHPNPFNHQHESPSIYQLRA